MNKINLKKDALDFDGNPAKDKQGKSITLANQAAAALSMIHEKDVLENMRLYEWISALNKTGTIEVNNPDKEKFEKHISETTLFGAHIKGQILTITRNDKS